MRSKCTRTILCVLISCAAAASVLSSAVFAESDWNLPNPVPYLGNEQVYFLGSGRCGGGGDTNGKWDFLIGPVYTSPSFIASETLSMADGASVIPVDPKMHRLEANGIFAGKKTVGDLDISLVEYTYRTEPWIARTVIVKNNSSQDKKLTLTATITKGEWCSTAQANPNSLTLCIEKGMQWRWIKGNENRWAEITFNTPSQAAKDGDTYRVTTEIAVAAKSSTSAALYHYLHFDEPGTPADYVADIQKRNPYVDCIAARQSWTKWAADGVRFDLPDADVTRILESITILSRMQQSYDGGLFAGTRIFDMSYGRDNHGGSRGALSLGHPEMVKSYIQFIANTFRKYGEIANAAQMGSGEPVTMAFPNQFSETPGYAALVMKYYYLTTGDMAFIKQHEDLLKHAITIQLDYAKKNNWTMPFHGDETEWWPCGGPGGFAKQVSSPSLNSTLVLLKSLEFYSDYLSKTGKKEQAKEYAGYVAKVKQHTVEAFRDPARNMLNWVSEPETKYVFNNFLLSPYYLGTDVDKELQINSVLYVLSQSRPNGTYPMIDTPNIASPSDTFTGHGLGLLLYNLAVIDHPKAESVFSKITKGGIVSAWGTVSEYYYPDGTTNDHYMRVWESNVTAEALSSYLFGLQIDHPSKRIKLHPHLPAAWNYARAANIPYGTHRISVGLEKQKNSWQTYIVVPEKVTLDLTLNAPDKIASLKINGQQARYTSVASRFGNGYIVNLSAAVPAGKTIVEVTTK